MDANSNVDSRTDGYAASDLHTSPNLYPCLIANSHALPNCYVCPQFHRPAMDANSNVDSRADGYAASDLHTSPNLYPCLIANSHALLLRLT